MSINEFDLVNLMFNNASIDTFNALWEEDNNAKEWGFLLHMCYCEESYESIGGDDGDSDNPIINYKRLEYLEELINFLEGLGIKEVEK